MSHIARRFLSPLLVIFLAGTLAGCYTLLKYPAGTDDSEDARIIYYRIAPLPPIIPEPWPIEPPPPVPPEPPPPQPTRPIDPKQPEKPATEAKEKVLPGMKTLEKTLEMESTRTS